MDDFRRDFEFLYRRNQRHHDFRNHFMPFMLHTAGRLDDGANLHGGNFRVKDAESASAQTKHGIAFMQVIDTRSYRFHALADFSCQSLDFADGMGQKLVQRRIKQSDGDRSGTHGLEKSVEIFALDREQFVECCFTAFDIVCKNHLPHGVDFIAAEEHVFRATKSDTFGTEGYGIFSLIGLIGIGADAELAAAIGPLHKLVVESPYGGIFRFQGFVDKDLDDFRVSGWYLSGDDLPGSAVNREIIAISEHQIVSLNAQFAFLIIDRKRSASHNTDLAHLACDKSRVRSHAASLCQNAFRNRHSPDVFGRGFDTHENNRFALFEDVGGIGGIETDPSRSSSRTCIEACCEKAAFTDRHLLFLQIEHRPEQLVELFGLNAHDRFVLIDQSFLDHIDGDFYCGQAGPLADPALQHEEPVVFDGELDIHHIAIVLFENRADIVELGVNFRIILLELFDFQRRSDAGYDIFALGIHQELTVENIVAVSCVAGKRNAGAALRPHIAEHHGLYVARRAPVTGNMVEPAVDNCAFVVPAVKDRTDSSEELFAGIFGERSACFFKDGDFVSAYEIFQILNRESGIEFDAKLVFFRFEDGFERIDLLFVGRFQIEHYVPVHLHEPAVAIPGETGIARFARKAFNGIGIEAEIEDGIHHARHRGSGT